MRPHARREDADRLVAVSLTPTPAGLEAGPPTGLFHAEFRGANTGYDVTADGQRFIILAGPNPELRPYLLLVNWLEDLLS